jgi:hypothetical protein
MTYLNLSTDFKEFEDLSWGSLKEVFGFLKKGDHFGVGDQFGSLEGEGRGFGDGNGGGDGGGYGESCGDYGEGYGVNIHGNDNL